MKNVSFINFKKMEVIKHLEKNKEKEKKEQKENEGNSNELTLKSIKLYEPVTWEQIQKANKKKYRNLKINILKGDLSSCLWHLERAIEEYKELINRTEFWEEKSTYEFNFKDWNTIKKTNGKITKYYNEIKKILKNIKEKE